MRLPTTRGYPRKYGHACDFSEKGQKRQKSGRLIRKFEQKCAKFQNILKKGR